MVVMQAGQVYCVLNVMHITEEWAVVKWPAPFATGTVLPHNVELTNSRQDCLFFSLSIFTFLSYLPIIVAIYVILTFQVIPSIANSQPPWPQIALKHCSNLPL